MLRGSEEAVSPVIGVVLMVGLTAIMVSTIAISVLAFTPPESAPQANIMVREMEGGLPSDLIEGITFDNNTIQLAHKGGDPLDITKTKLIIAGIGQSHRVSGGYVPATSPYTGNVRVVYLNLTKYGKHYKYNTHNNLILQDGFWAAGENLLLSGEDSQNGNDDVSSVWVSVDGDGETSNNYGFKVGENVQITVMDISTNQVIAMTFATVKPIN